MSTPGRHQSKKIILSTNVDQKSLETEFLVGRQMAKENTVFSDF